MCPRSSDPFYVVTYYMKLVLLIGHIIVIRVMGIRAVYLWVVQSDWRVLTNPDSSFRQKLKRSISLMGMNHSIMIKSNEKIINYLLYRCTQGSKVWCHDVYAGRRLIMGSNWGGHMKIVEYQLTEVLTDRWFNQG